MRDRNDVNGTMPVDAALRKINDSRDATYIAGPPSGPPGLEAERQRLENERVACQASLQRLEADLRSLDAERERLQDAVEPNASARLCLLAGMSVDLRTALHGLLGYVQLFRLRGGLDPVQTEWVNAMLAAGAQLLGKVQCVVNVADIEAEPNAWHIDDGELSVDMPDCPAAAWPAPAPENLAPAPAPVRQTALHVLVADDDAMNRDVVASFARAAGHTVVVAETGARAVMAAESEDFDVILMDVCMPHIDGLEATRRIRAIPGARGSVPVIALTAKSHSDGVAACRIAGMNGHLAKPFRFDTLNTAILEAAQGHAQHGAGLHGAATAVPERRDPVERPVFGQPNLGWRAPGQPMAASAGAMPRNRAGQLAQTASAPGSTGSSWRDIACPWNATSPSVMERQKRPRSAYILDTQYQVRFTAIGSRQGRRLVAGSIRSCVPPPERAHHEFHWLLYADPVPMDASAYTATCDLWRWIAPTWQSIAVLGASFSPDEMFEQGWRYCGPCFERTAVVEII